MAPKASNDLDPRDLNQFMMPSSVHHVSLMLLEIKVDGILCLATMKELCLVTLKKLASV